MLVALTPPGVLLIAGGGSPPVRTPRAEPRTAARCGSRAS
jgi:hypothetical protein